jgi:hypothetical protein
MLTCDALRFAVMAALAIAYATHHLTLPMIYVGVFVLAIGGAIFLGAQTPSIPYLLGMDRSKSAIAALAATEQSVNLIAPPIGGVIFALVGPLPMLAANAFTYAASQLSIASVRSFGPESPRPLPSVREMGGDIAAGWRFVMSDRAMRAFSLSHSVMNFVGSIGFIALIPYLKRAFGVGDHVVGIAFGCFAAGAALGSLIAGRTQWPVGPALIAAFFFDGVGSLPFTHSLVVAIAGITLSSVCAGYRITTSISWRLRVIPEELVGRTFGVIRMLILLLVFPGSILGGWLADSVGVRPTMLISAYGYLAMALVLLLFPSVRNERR